MEKVRYERRLFYQELGPKDGISIDQLIGPLEKICLELGGSTPGVESTIYSPDGFGRKIRTNVTYLVGKKNGAATLVELDVCLAGYGYRVVVVTNVKKYEHPELLAALHAFYDGKPGYRGMPEP